MVGHYYNRVTVKPPINGAFPFDTEGKCTLSMEKYLECIKEVDRHLINQNENEAGEKCRDLMQLYLECRKQNNLI